MVRKGRLTQQVEGAIKVLKEEGSIIVPMSVEDYNKYKDYKICIIEQIHEIQKDKINWTVQMLLFERIIEELNRQGRKIKVEEKEGIIRLQ